jgi:hypothetical protein
MGRRPSIKHSIDRINNDGGYWCGKCEECLRLGRPANCRWATHIEQGRNMRRNRFLSFYGRSQTLSDWSREKGVSVPSLIRRLAAGVTDPEELFAVPGSARASMITHNGETLRASEWCARLGLKPATVCMRLKRGLTGAAALGLTEGSVAKQQEATK